MKVPIVGFEDKYAITDTGDVISVKRQGTTGSALKHQIMSNGYHRVTLRDNGRKQQFYVHRLVAEHFLQNPLNKPCVNHKDGNKGNNKIQNLEWCTYAENMTHAIRNQLSHTPHFCGEQHPMHKVSAEDVSIIRRMSADGTDHVAIAKLFGITKEQVHNIVVKKHWKDVIL